MARVQNAAEIGQDMRAEQRRAVHNLRDAFQPLCDLDVVDHSIDGRERALDLLDRHANFKRHVFLRIERIRRGHPTAHPEQNTRIGSRLGMINRFVGIQTRFAHGQRGRTRCCHLLQKIAADQ